MKVLAIVLLAFVLCNAQLSNPQNGNPVCRSSSDNLPGLENSDATVMELIPPEIPAGMETVFLHAKYLSALQPGNVVQLVADHVQIPMVDVVSIGPGWGNVTLLVTKEQAETIRSAKSLTLTFRQVLVNCGAVE